MKVGPNVPFTSISPTMLESFSVNHKLFPDGLAAIQAIPPNGTGTSYSVIVPWGVILPTWLPASSVNQRFPSGPGLMSHGSAFSVINGKSVWLKGLVGSSRTMLLPISSVNQMFPSAPVAIPVGNWPMPVGYSSMAPVAGWITPTWSTFSSVNQRSPLGSAVMSQGWAFGVGTMYSVIWP